MKQMMTAENVLSRYKLFDRNFCRLEADERTVTVWIDLFHTDDPQRDDESRDYPLSLSVVASDFKMLEGDVGRMQGEFSSDILSAEAAGGKLEMLCDCDFFDGGGRDVVRFVIGGTIEVDDHPVSAAGQQ